MDSSDTVIICKCAGCETCLVSVCFQYRSKVITSWRLLSSLWQWVMPFSNARCSTVLQWVWESCLNSNMLHCCFPYPVCYSHGGWLVHPARALKKNPAWYALKKTEPLLAIWWSSIKNCVATHILKPDSHSQKTKLNAHCLILLLSLSCLYHPLTNHWIRGSDTTRWPPTPTGCWSRVWLSNDGGEYYKWRGRRGRREGSGEWGVTYLHFTRLITILSSDM